MECMDLERLFIFLGLAGCCCCEAAEAALAADPEAVLGDISASDMLTNAYSNRR